MPSGGLIGWGEGKHMNRPKPDRNKRAYRKKVKAARKQRRQHG